MKHLETDGYRPAETLLRNWEESDGGVRLSAVFTSVAVSPQEGGLWVRFSPAVH